MRRKIVVIVASLISVFFISSAILYSTTTVVIENSAMQFAHLVGHIVHVFWNYTVVTIDKKPITVANILIALGVMVLLVRLIKRLRLLLRKRLLSRFPLEQSVADALEKIGYYVLLALAALIALDIANVPLTIFTFLGGALAIGVGFGSQNIISNFISGLILMVERPIKVGDLIDVNNTVCRVISIGTRCTHLRTATNINMLVPNSSLLESRIINWTLNNADLRFTLTVAAANGSDPDIVQQLIVSALNENDHIMKEPAPMVSLVNFGEKGLQFDIDYWISLNCPIERKQVVSALLFRILAHFKENNINIALPHQDMMIEGKKPLEVKLLSSK